MHPNLNLQDSGATHRPPYRFEHRTLRLLIPFPTVHVCLPCLPRGKPDRSSDARGWASGAHILFLEIVQIGPIA